MSAVSWAVRLMPDAGRGDGAAHGAVLAGAVGHAEPQRGDRRRDGAQHVSCRRRLMGLCCGCCRLMGLWVLVDRGPMPDAGHGTRDAVTVRLLVLSAMSNRRRATDKPQQGDRWRRCAALLMPW